MSIKRKKNLSAEEFRKTYKEKEKLVFHNFLPFSNIKDPRNIIICATHYSSSNCLMVNKSGTAYVFCPDQPHNIIKFYEYYLSGNPNDGGTILEVEKKDIPNHHIKNVDEIPSFIIEQSPNEVIVNIKKILK